MSRGYRMRGKLRGHTVCQQRKQGRRAEVLATLARAGAWPVAQAAQVAHAAPRGRPRSMSRADPGRELYCAGNLAFISQLAMAAADAAMARRARAEASARFAFVDYRHLKAALLDFVSAQMSAIPRGRSRPTRRCSDFVD